VRGGYGEGRALSAKDAKTAGMIDRIATMDETLARLTGRARVGGMRAEADDTDLCATTDPLLDPTSRESLDAQQAAHESAQADQARTRRLRLL